MKILQTKTTPLDTPGGVDISFSDIEINALYHDLHNNYRASGTAYELRLLLEKIISGYEAI